MNPGRDADTAGQSLCRPPRVQLGENQRDYLIRLLSQRLGRLLDSRLSRIKRADVVLLERWFERGITAPSLDAVFADEP